MLGGPRTRPAAATNNVIALTHNGWNNSNVVSFAAGDSDRAHFLSRLETDYTLS